MNQNETLGRFLSFLVFFSMLSDTLNHNLLEFFSRCSCLGEHVAVLSMRETLMITISYHDVEDTP